jgi:hypothetical protein
LLRWLGIALLALPFLYVLLTGPAIGLVLSGRLGGHEQRWLIDAFDPANRIAGGTVFERPLERYVDWWAKLLGPELPPGLLEK